MAQSHEQASSGQGPFSRIVEAAREVVNNATESFEVGGPPPTATSSTPVTAEVARQDPSHAPMGTLKGDATIFLDGDELRERYGYGDFD